MTIKEVLKKYPKIEIELLLMHVLKQSREFLFMEPEYQLPANRLISLQKLIKRRKNGEPMAYILGYKDFYGYRFKVNKNVLIPRPETELIVESIKYQVESMGQKKIRILDVGTGSGCIAVSLSKNIKADIYASDISEKALVVAKQNAKKYGVKIKFIKSNLLKNIKQNFDIIIANLPYGWHGLKNRFSSIKDGLKYEPQMALFTKEKGLFEVRRLLEQIAARKYQPKLIYLEFDPRQKLDLSRQIKKCMPKANIKFYKDLNHLWRCVKITIA